jgi:hypothetical protein
MSPQMQAALLINNLRMATLAGCASALAYLARLLSFTVNSSLLAIPTVFNIYRKITIDLETCQYLRLFFFDLPSRLTFVTIFDRCCTSVKNVAKTVNSTPPTPGVAGCYCFTALSVLNIMLFVRRYSFQLQNCESLLRVDAKFCVAAGFSKLF